MKKMILLNCSFIVILTAGCGPPSEMLAVTMVVQTDIASTLKAVGMPTNTPIPTDTLLPTDTPPILTKTIEPTNTPDIALTEQFNDFFSLLEQFERKGYVVTTEGEAIDLEPFEQEWAQIDWFRWWGFDFIAKDFLYKGHFEWLSATSTPDDSGCGVVFGIQENGDYYAVFVISHRILFLRNKGENLYEVGKTRGSGRTNFENSDETDFVIAVKDQSAYVSIDGEITEYTLSLGQTTEGNFAYSLLSGTNKDFGTRCEITDSMIWISE